jgi:hypothetical protein
MTFIGQKDFLIEVSKGNVPGHSLVHKFGRNSDVANGAWEHISQVPFDTANFRQSAISMRIKAGGNAADTAAGAGAREVTIQGIDSNGDETSEAITTAGASASSATTETFWRIHRAWVSAAGTYTGNNTGDIVIEDSGGGADFITIAAGEGQTQYAGFTIPAGKTGHLLTAEITVATNKSANVRVFTRADYDDVTAPMPAKRLKLWFDGVSGNLRFAPDSPELVLPAKTDIWFEAYGDGAAAAVSADFELLLVDD